MSRHPGKPGHVRLRVLPADIDHRTAPPAPAAIGRRVAAAAHPHARVPLHERDLVHPHRERGPDRHRALRAFDLSPELLRLRGAHRERPRRYHDHLRTKRAVAEHLKHLEHLFRPVRRPGRHTAFPGAPALAGEDFVAAPVVVARKPVVAGRRVRLGRLRACPEPHGETLERRDVRIRRRGETDRRRVPDDHGMMVPPVRPDTRNFRVAAEFRAHGPFHVLPVIERDADPVGHRYIRPVDHRDALPAEAAAGIRGSRRAQFAPHAHHRPHPGLRGGRNTPRE